MSSVLESGTNRDLRLEPSDLRRMDYRGDNQRFGDERGNHGSPNGAGVPPADPPRRPPPSGRDIGDDASQSDDHDKKAGPDWSGSNRSRNATKPGSQRASRRLPDTAPAAIPTDWLPF